VNYYAPNPYWVVPNSGSTVTCYVQTTDSNGNLTTVSTLTAIVHNQSSGTDPNSFTGSGAYSANVYTGVGTNGSNVFTAGGRVGSGVAQLRMWLVYTGNIYDQPPNAPGIITPANSSIATTQTPTFQASFSDPTSGDSLAQYQIQVYNGSNGSGALAWDSGNVAANSSEIAAGQLNRICGISLTYGNSYSWRCRMANNNGNWGSFSSWANFQVLQGPDTPGNITPNGIQATLTPGWSFLYTSPASTALKSYHLTITNSGGGLVYDFGSINDSSASGTTISGTVPGGANLQYGNSYIFNVVVVDNSNITGPTGTSSFSIASLPTATPISPVGNATVGTHTPTFTWGFNDTNGYTQQSYQIKVYNNGTGALIKNTGVVSSAATSYTLSGASVAYSTTIRWTIQVVNTGGLASGFSASQYAYVNNAPSATITNPTNSSTITTNTPSVTWTYTASAGGQSQSSATITLMDANGNTIATYTQSGTGTSYTLSAGILANATTYQLQVTVTDTVSATGTSSTITFTLLYTSPADMAGQPLTTAKNYIFNPWMSVDSDSDGLADSIGIDTIPSGITADYSVDTSISQPVSRNDGNGAVAGAQRIAITNVSVSGSHRVQIWQLQDISDTGWTPNSTHLSVCCNMRLDVTGGSPLFSIVIVFYDASWTEISEQSSTGHGTTSNQIVRYLGPQNLLVPTNTAHVEIDFRLTESSTSDACTVWVMDAQVEAASASDANFIAGDIGPGYSFDTHGYSVRTQISGAVPTLISNPGTPTDPIGSNGGTLTLGWDTSFADATRFVQYIIERRRQDQAGDDSAWIALVTISDKTVANFTDFTVGSTTVYQYAVRQQIQYTDGSTGVSAHRAIVSGACNFSPAWYITNIDGLIYNVRLNTVDINRALTWKENAVYTPFLGRVGQARDSGEPLGYAIALTVYYDDTWGDVRPVVRRQFIAMQRLSVIWNLKDPEGLVVPVSLQDVDFNEQDQWSDTLLTVVLHLLQANDSVDY
jgi:hypothetical protein